MEAMRPLLGNVHPFFHPFIQVMSTEDVLVLAAGQGPGVCLHRAFSVLEESRLLYRKT